MDEQSRKKALGMIPYGLYVVGVGRGDAVGAFTANWVCQASFQPPLLMLGVRSGARPRRLIEREGVLSVNILAVGQKPLAAHFFRWHEPRGGRFGGVAFTTGVTGAPVLPEAAARLECRVRRIVAGGDHDIVVAEVVEAVYRGPSEPLLLADTGWSYGG